MSGIGWLMLDSSIFNGAGGANENSTKNRQIVLKRKFSSLIYFLPFSKQFSIGRKTIVLKLFKRKPRLNIIKK